MLNFWQAYFRLTQTAGDANVVIAMRMMRLVSGGALAQREMQWMFAEKRIAIAQAQAAAATKMVAGGGIAAMQKSASDVYRRKVRANRRQLVR